MIDTELLTMHTDRLAERLREIAERPTTERLLRAELAGLADAIERLPEDSEAP